MFAHLYCHVYLNMCFDFLRSWYRFFFSLRVKGTRSPYCSLPTLLNRPIRIYPSALVSQRLDGAGPALLNHQRRFENIAARVVCGARTRNNFLVCILKTCRIYCLLNRATNITRHAQFGWPATARRSALSRRALPLLLLTDSPLCPFAN